MQQTCRHWLEGVSRCLLVLDHAAGGAGSMSGLLACSSRFAAGSNLRLACKLGCFCQCCYKLWGLKLLFPQSAYGLAHARGPSRPDEVAGCSCDTLSRRDRQLR